MNIRPFNVAKEASVPPCPQCGNSVEFVARAQQVAEDLCEVWVICACGYDPTREHPDMRLEDVWGTLDNATVTLALQCSWAEPLSAERSA